MSDQKLSLRDHIESAVEQVENTPSVEEVAQPEPEVTAIAEENTAITEEPTADRDDKGRFVAKEQQSEPTKADQAQIDEVMSDPEVKRPTTWKKEYLSLWDKAYNGEPLTKEEGRKLTAYLDQRESEYKKGVSTYKEEARRAKAYEEAIMPFVPDLQKRNINPAQYIQALAKADQILTYATPEQKMQYFQQLAQSYGIQLNQSGQFQQLDPYAQQLTQLLAQNQQEVQSIKSRLEMEERQKLVSEVERFAKDEKYPHFEVLREKMAQLLDANQAQDLKSAYELALWMTPDIREQEIKNMVAKQTAVVNKQAQVQKAKAASVSVKSSTPSGSVPDTEKKDRRAILAEQIAASLGSRV